MTKKWRAYEVAWLAYLLIGLFFSIASLFTIPVAVSGVNYGLFTVLGRMTMWLLGWPVLLFFPL